MNEWHLTQQDSERIRQKNLPKFEVIRSLNLPPQEYAITGSGALGIRNLREIGDIDIVVSADLWRLLAEKYGTIFEEGVEKVVFPDGIVEALGAHSYSGLELDRHAPSVAQRIAQAEIIEGLPFESLEHVLYYKRKMGREKDLKDIELIVSSDSFSTVRDEKVRSR